MLPSLDVQEGRNGFPQIRQKLKLVVEDEKIEDDISYAYSGYAPLSVRIVQVSQLQKASVL